MHPVLEDALRNVVADPCGEWGCGLWLYVEMRNSRSVHAGNASLYESLIPACLRALPLEDADQAELTGRLVALAAAHPETKVRHLALTCLSAVRAWAGLEPVIGLLLEHWRDYSAEELRVSTSAMEQLTDVLYLPEGLPDDSPLRAEVMPAARAVDRRDLRPTLRAIADRLRSISDDPGDEHERRAAEQTLERIPRLERRISDARKMVRESLA